jgi:hypothetical protein
VGRCVTLTGLDLRVSVSKVRQDKLYSQAARSTEQCPAACRVQLEKEGEDEANGRAGGAVGCSLCALLEPSHVELIGCIE